MRLRFLDRLLPPPGPVRCLTGHRFGSLFFRCEGPPVVPVTPSLTPVSATPEAWAALRWAPTGHFFQNDANAFRAAGCVSVLSLARAQRGRGSQGLAVLHVRRDACHLCIQPYATLDTCMSLMHANLTLTSLARRFLIRQTYRHLCSSSRQSHRYISVGIG